jgi:hypothetical protein
MLPASLCSLVLLLSVASAQKNISVDDNDRAIAYSNYPGWNTLVWAQQSPPPSNGTNHATPYPGASAMLNFIGTAGASDWFFIAFFFYSDRLLFV